MQGIVEEVPEKGKGGGKGKGKKGVPTKISSAANITYPYQLRFWNLEEIRGTFPEVYEVLLEKDARHWNDTNSTFLESYAKNEARQKEGSEAEASAKTAAAGAAGTEQPVVKGSDP